MNNQINLVLSIASRLKGKVKGTFNGSRKWEVNCPYCGRRSGMIGLVRTGDYYLYKCPACETSISLKTLVKEKFPDLKKELHQNENTWHPIKNRVPRGSAKNKRSFKERQESRSLAQEIMMRAKTGKSSSQ
jgi:uncharacterized Zn finger protein (UPF0148 family)